MVRATIDISEIRRALRRIPLNKRAKLLSDLQNETARERLRETVDRVRKHLQKNPVSQKEIDEAVKAVQRNYYAQRRS